MKQLAFDLAVPPAPSLENFVTGRNAEAVQRLREIVRGAGGERFLYLWGAPASGRTHLMRAAAAEFERAGVRAAYIAGGDAAEAADTGLEAAAVDDVDRLDQAAQAVLFNLYNWLRDSGGALVAAGNAAPQALRLRADLASRLAWGFVYEVHVLSDAEKTHALADHAAARGFSLPPEVVSYLLARVPRDMRTLTVMVESLDRYSLEAKRAVTVPLVRELLEKSL